MSGIVADIQAKMRQAMRDKRRDEVSTLRLALAAVQREIKDNGAGDDARLFATLATLIKQRREAAELYDKGGRDELAAAERDAIPVIESLLPPPLSADELKGEIADAIAKSGAVGVADMGKVMKILSVTAAGRADMRQLSAEVRAALGA